MSTQETFLIVGATSAIAEATARLWAAEGTSFYLLARNPQKLMLVAQDLIARGASVRYATLDVNDTERHRTVLEEAGRALGRIDVVLIAHGELPDQRKCEDSVDLSLDSIKTNALSVVAMLTVLANMFRSQGRGVIAVIGSVAGDRGRKSNYVYGSAKALIAVYLEGLAGRMRQYGVSVLNIKPGFVDTPMTAKIKKGALWVKPEAIAAVIQARVAAGRSGSYYAPRFWWVIMLIIKLLPSRLLYRLNI